MPELNINPGGWAPFDIGDQPEPVKVKTRRKSSKDTQIDPDLVYFDIYTNKVIPSEYVFRMREGVCDKRTLVLTPYNVFISIFSSNTVRSSVENGFVDIRECEKIIIGFNDNTKSYIFDYYFKQSIRFPRAKISGGTYYVLNPEIAIKIGLLESIYDGIFYQKGFWNPSTEPIKYHDFEYPNITSSTKDLIKYGIKSPTNVITENKNYSFGVEIETAAGYIPSYVAANLNMKSVYDGSIRDNQGNKHVGGEYVTGVLFGDNGLRHLNKIVTELSQRCSINNTCSVHVHVGNLSFNKETIVLLWKTCQAVESELFAMLPTSRSTSLYCNKMKQLPIKFNKKGYSYDVLIDEYYKKIFKIISLGKEPCKTINKEFNHPAGHSCGYDTSTPRYWWINFIPAMFNLKGKGNYTIEFRPHSATLNFIKIKNWILIVLGIVSFVENHQKFIINNDKITLRDIIKLTYPNKHEYLMEYINKRTEFFSVRGNNSLSEKSEYEPISNQNSSITTLKETLWG